MSYQHIEEIQSRRSEKIALFLTVENAAGLIIAASPGAGQTGDRFRLEGAPTAYTEGEEVSFKLIGDLTVRETTQPATFDVTATLTGDTLTGVATTRLLMSGFGIEPPNFANTLTVADEFGIEVQFTAKEL